MNTFPNSDENSPLVESLRAEVTAGRRSAKGIVVHSVSEHPDARLTIALGHDSGLQLAIGRPVQVNFPDVEGSGCEGQEQLSLTGRVVARSEDGCGVLWEIFFPRAATGTLAPLLNRRGALRIKPAPNRPVRVRLRAFAGALELDLEAHDLSAAGVALLVSPTLEARLAAARKVELVIRLPDDPNAHRLPGFILRRRLIGAHVQYGIHFEEQGTLMEREAIQRWALAQRCGGGRVQGRAAG